MPDILIAFLTGSLLSSGIVYFFVKNSHEKLIQDSQLKFSQTINELNEEKSAIQNELDSEKARNHSQKNLTIEKISNAFHASSELMEEMTHSLGDIQAQVNSTSEPIENINNASAEAQQMIQISQSSMQNLSDAIKHLHEVTNLVNRLLEHMNQVTEKSQVIHNIANQANLLSLNAAIEAARAGEAGRGFGVVANDMNRLSELSASSAQEITKILSGGMKDVEAINNEMNEKVELFSKVSKTVCNNFKTMQETINGINGISDLLNANSISAVENVKNVTENTQTNMESLTKLLSDVTGMVSGNPIHDLPPTEVKPKLDEFVIIDVRSPKEFNDELSHIEGATLYCLQDNFKEAISELDRDANYLFVCRSGGRSARGARIAQALGFKHVTNMAGGMLEWRKAYPLAS